MIQEFIVAKDIKDALQLKRDKAKSMWYAGGTEINRLGTTLDVLTAISLRELGLGGISEDADGIRIGSMTTLQQLVESPSVPAWLKQAALNCGSFVRRNMATIGGNLALMSDHSYLAPALLASRCTLIAANLTESGSYIEDEIPVREYHAYRQQFGGSLLLSLHISKDGRFVASKRFAISQQNHSAVNVGFGATRESEQVISHVRMYAAVHGSPIQRLGEVENAIETGELTTAEDVQLAVQHALSASDDLYGSAEYKRYIAGEGIGRLFAEFLRGDVK